MDDIIGYILVLGMIVIPAYWLVMVCRYILRAVYENQSLIVSLPFP